MTTFYRLKENGTILDYTEIDVIYDEEGNAINVPAFIKELYTETDREIIVLTDGSFAFKDTVDLVEEAKRKAEKEFNEAKQAKIAELKNHRDTEEVTPILYNGNYFDYDEKARDRIKDAQALLEGTESTIKWTTATNTDAYLGYADFKAIRGAVAIRADVLHQKYRTLREQVDTATTINELEEIEWGDI
jgi:hypothetical protein